MRTRGHSIHPDGSRGDPLGVMTRRGFGGLAAASGFALAVRPVAASAITTPSMGLVTKDITVTADDGALLPGYVAYPEGAGPFPTIHVVHEIFGVHEYIRDVCRRFAQAGYCAASVNLYARAGDPSTLSSFEEIRPIVATAGPAQVNADLDAVGRYLAANEPADMGRLGITGFCWGGAVVWMYSAHNPDLGAGVAWYGRLVPPPDNDSRPFPIDIAEEIKAPVLGLYGGQDRLISEGDIERMKAAISAAGDKGIVLPTIQFITYEDAGHGFHADYRPSYDVAAATDGWGKMMRWFAANGVA